jgi:GH24 family phage-related lysozyme (muramidase)
VNGKDALPDLIVWEGRFPYLYLDSEGLVTAGIGNLLSTPASAVALAGSDPDSGWWLDDRQATLDEVIAAWNTVKAAPRGYEAHWYGHLTGPRLRPGFMDALAIHRCDVEFLPACRHFFPGFDNYPRPAQRGILDLAYNRGIHGITEYHKLREAAEAGAWLAAAKESGVGNGRKSRNLWRAGLIATAAIPS